MCYVQPSREAEAGAGTESAESTGNWEQGQELFTLSVCCLFFCAFWFIFFLLLLLFPGANYDSTTRLQAKRLGQEVMHMSGSLGVRRKICQWQNAAKATTVRQAGSIPSCCMQIFPAHTAKLCCQSPLQLFSHPPTPFQSCTCATPLLELTSSIFRIFCNTIFILYLRISLPSLSLCFSLYPSRCTSSFVVVVVVAAGNRKP